MAKRKPKDPIPPRPAFMAAPSTLRPEAAAIWSELLEIIELSNVDCDDCDAFLLARLANNLKALADAEADLAKAGSAFSEAPNGMKFVNCFAKRVDVLSAENRQLLKLTGLTPSSRKVRPTIPAGGRNDIELSGLDPADFELTEEEFLEAITIR